MPLHVTTIVRPTLSAPRHTQTPLVQKVDIIKPMESIDCSTRIELKFVHDFQALHSLVWHPSSIEIEGSQNGFEDISRTVPPREDHLFASDVSAGESAASHLVLKLLI